MAFYCLRNEGVFIGPSAALNVVGAVKLAVTFSRSHARARARAQQWALLISGIVRWRQRKLGAGSTVATVLCDSGERYRRTTYNVEWLEEKGLSPTSEGTDLQFVL